MVDIIEAISIALFAIGLLMAMNEDTSKLYVNFIGVGLFAVGALTLNITDKYM